MSNIRNFKNRKELIQELTTFLPVLRASIGISQGELAELVGISRQTYGAIESKRRDMSWNTFLSLVLFFTTNHDSSQLIMAKGDFMKRVYDNITFEIK